MQDRDIVVHDVGGSGTTAVLGAIVLSVILAAAWYLAIGPRTDGRSNPDDHTTINLSVPSALPEATPKAS